MAIFPVSGTWPSPGITTCVTMAPAFLKRGISRSQAAALGSFWPLTNSTGLPTTALKSLTETIGPAAMTQKPA